MSSGNRDTSLLPFQFGWFVSFFVVVVDLFCFVLFLSNCSGKAEKAESTHSSTLACKVPWAEEPGRLQSMRVHFHSSLSCIGEGHSNPLLAGESQGRGAWWAAVYGVRQSRTRLKRLSSSSRACSVQIALSSRYLLEIISSNCLISSCFR